MEGVVIAGVEDVDGGFQPPVADTEGAKYQLDIDDQIETRTHSDAATDERGEGGPFGGELIFAGWKLEETMK